MMRVGSGGRWWNMLQDIALLISAMSPTSTVHAENGFSACTVKVQRRRARVVVGGQRCWSPYPR